MTEPDVDGQRSREPERSDNEQPKNVTNTPRTKPKPVGLRSPILAERTVGRLELLHRRLPVSARLARVFVTGNGRSIEYSPEKQPTTGELLWSGVRAVYDVDLGVHVTQIEASPPSHGDKIAFHAVVDLVWQVAKPAVTVRTGIQDVGRAVSPSLLRRLRAVTRGYEIEDSEMAEKAANEEFRDRTLGTEFGLTLEVFVRLAMDDSILHHAAIQRRVEVFKDIISAGDFNQFALQLAAKPDDVGIVVQMLVDERDTHRKAVFDFVTRLLESDALDRWQIDDQVRTTLQWLRESGYKVLAGSDEARTFSYGENHRKPASGPDNGTSGT